MQDVISSPFTPSSTFDSLELGELQGGPGEVSLKWIIQNKLSFW